MAFSKDIKFVSPEPIYSRIKEELKSYFNTGYVDELMFPVWTKDCIEKFKSTYLPIEPAVIDIFNGRGELPCDFKLVREVWACATIHKGPIQSPFTFYYQTDCRIHPTFIGCSECASPECNPNSCSTPTPVALPNLCDLHLNNSNGCICATGDQFRITHKVQTNFSFDFTVEGMLMPGNYKTMGTCWEHSPNRSCHTLDRFDINGNYITTSFRSGTIFLLYYADPYLDEDNYYEIPDNYFFKEFLRWYIKFNIFQGLFESSTGDEGRLTKDKRDDAESRMLNAEIEARSDAMSQTVYDVQKSIVRSYNKNRRFKIS